jgi:hypothetical protein
MTCLESILAGNDFTGRYNHNPETDKAPWFGRPLYKNVVLEASGTYQKLDFESLSAEGKAKRIENLLDKIGSKLYGPMPGKIKPEGKHEGDTYTATYKIKNTNFTEGLLYPKYERTLTVNINTKTGDISIKYEAPKVPKAIADKDAARLYSALKARNYMFARPEQAEEPNGEEAEADAEAHRETPMPTPTPDENHTEGGEQQNGYEVWAQQGMQNNYIPRLLQTIRQAAAQRQGAQAAGG